jgi:hypothetical protein
MDIALPLALPCHALSAFLRENWLAAEMCVYELVGSCICDSEKCYLGSCLYDGNDEKQVRIRKLL